MKAEREWKTKQNETKTEQSIQELWDSKSKALEIQWLQKLDGS